MPPRHVTLAIVAFWLATTGWLFYRDLWPRLRPAGPPYTIDLAQEARDQNLPDLRRFGAGAVGLGALPQANGSYPMLADRLAYQPNRWSVFRNGVTIGTAQTWVQPHPEDDTYELHTKMEFQDFSFKFGLMGFGAEARVRYMDSMYRVTQGGELREVTGQGLVIASVPLKTFPFKMHVSGHAVNRLFRPHVHVESPLGNQEVDMDPVEVPAQYSMLSPMHPWNRLLGLHENQRWRITQFDPLTDSLAALTPGAKTGSRSLEAGVLQGTQTRFWNHQEVPCLVIEYRGDDKISGQTWVRQSDGLVLRQEATRKDSGEVETLALEREAMMIEFHEVTKSYGTTVALDRLTLQVQAGELFAFLGPNGAGKTTTIKLMVGLLFPTAGTVRVGGFDMQRQGDQARQLISYVPDQPFLYEKLTGREFLRFIADMYGMPRENARRRIEDMIATFGLETFVDDLTERYSHGMKQRTVFAAAFLHEPRLLIVDEPTVGLDPRSVRLLKDLLRREADRGATVFLSTHSLDIAQELAGRIGIVDHGRLISCGSLDALRKQAALDGSLEDVFLKLTEETSTNGAV